MGLSTKIHLLQIQSKERLPKSPFIYWPSDNSSKYTDYISSALSLFKKHNLSFICDHDIYNVIEGDMQPLVNLISPLSAYDKKSMKTHQIIYLEQLTSPDSVFLLSWKDVALTKYRYRTNKKLA